MEHVRLARPEELTLLPDIERAADAMFTELGIGPLPGPCTVAELTGALAVLVIGEPPVGFARIDSIAGGAHLEQLSVHPDHGHQGRGRDLLNAAAQWAQDHDFHDITLATYRDVKWNGPFYASEGFVEIGSADDWWLARGYDAEEPIMGRFGTRVVMRLSW